MKIFRQVNDISILKKGLSNIDLNGKHKSRIPVYKNRTSVVNLNSINLKSKPIIPHTYTDKDINDTSKRKPIQVKSSTNSRPIHIINGINSCKIKKVLHYYILGLGNKDTI